MCGISQSSPPESGQSSQECPRGKDNIAPPQKKLLLKILKRNILKTSVLFHLFCLKLGNRIRLGRARVSLLLTLIYYPFACPGQNIFLILAILDKKFKLYAYIHT